MLIWLEADEQWEDWQKQLFAQMIQSYYVYIDEHTEELAQYYRETDGNSI
jgi:hypothetical protein